MKKIYGLILGLLLVPTFLFPVACSPVSSSPVSTPFFLTYQSADYHFSIQYPQGWQVTEQTLQESLNIPENGPSHVPVQFQSPGRECDVSIMVTSLSYLQMTFDDWSNKILSVANNTSSPDLGSRILDSGKATLAGKPAYQVHYTHQQVNMHMEILDVWGQFGQESWQVTAAVFKPAKYSDWLPIIQQMVDSFEITP